MSHGRDKYKARIAICFNGSAVLVSALPDPASKWIDGAFLDDNGFTGAECLEKGHVYDVQIVHEWNKGGWAGSEPIEADSYFHIVSARKVK